jgi:hypothetical protein
MTPPKAKDDTTLTNAQLEEIVMKCQEKIFIFSNDNDLIAESRTVHIGGGKTDDAQQAANYDFIHACSPQVVRSLATALIKAREVIGFYANDNILEIMNMIEDAEEYPDHRHGGKRARAWQQEFGNE